MVAISWSSQFCGPSTYGPVSVTLSRKACTAANLPYRSFQSCLSHHLWATQKRHYPIEHNSILESTFNGPDCIKCCRLMTFQVWQRLKRQRKSEVSWLLTRFMTNTHVPQNSSSAPLGSRQALRERIAFLTGTPWSFWRYRTLLWRESCRHKIGRPACQFIARFELYK